MRCVACGQTGGDNHHCPKLFEQRRELLERMAVEREPEEPERTFADRLEEAVELLGENDG